MSPAPDSPGAKQPAEHLRSLNACSEAVEWASKYRTRSAAWKACKRGDWMLWYCSKNAGPVGDERRKLLVLAACECARLALPIWQKRYPDDKRVETCLDTAEKWARNEATLEALQVSRKNCYAAADTADAAYAAADAAYAAADAAAYAAADAAAAAAADAAAAAAYAERLSTLAQCAAIVRRTLPCPVLP